MPVSNYDFTDGAGLITIEAHGNFVERRCFMAARCVMDILPRKQFCVYIGNLTAKEITQPKFMIVAYALNASTCVIHARDDELHLLRDKARMQTQSDKAYSHATTNATYYRH